MAGIYTHQYIGEPVLLRVQRTESGDAYSAFLGREGHHDRLQVAGLSVAELVQWFGELAGTLDDAGPLDQLL